MAKLGIPASLPPAPDSEQLGVMCEFCFAPQTHFLVVRRKPGEEEGAGSGGLGSAPPRAGNVTVTGAP